MKVILQLQVSQVPEDPQRQAEEDEDGSCEDQEVPETKGSKDPDQKEDEACSIHEEGNEEIGLAAAHEPFTVHDGKNGCTFSSSQYEFIWTLRAVRAEETLCTALPVGLSWVWREGRLLNTQVTFLSVSTSHIFHVTSCQQVKRVFWWCWFQTLV